MCFKETLRFACIFCVGQLCQIFGRILDAYSRGPGIGPWLPCAMIFDPACLKDTAVARLLQFKDKCWKSCIHSSTPVYSIGTQRQMPYNMGLVINSAQLQRFSFLQAKQTEAEMYMVCGGRTFWNADGTEERQPLYWSLDTNNMPASCGRCMPAEELYLSDWRRTPKAKVWFCPGCLSDGSRFWK